MADGGIFWDIFATWVGAVILSGLTSLTVQTTFDFTTFDRA
jgi:hypothetical protein